MGLDLALDGTGAEAGGDGIGCRCGRLVEPACIPRCDLAAQRTALAEADSGVPRGGRPAGLLHRLDLDSRKSGLLELLADDGAVVIAVWRARQKLRRIGGEEGG